jgi:hypothetical protein
MGGVGATSSDLNKGGSPTVATRTKMEICQMSVPIDLGGVSCSRRLHRQPPLGASCLKVAGLDGRAHPCFYLTIWFQRERHEALLFVTIMWHYFSFHGEVS